MIANNIILTNPTHPGEVLQEEIDYRGISHAKLADEIGITTSCLNDLLTGKQDFTIEYALMIEAALGIEADFWMNMQSAYNKSRARQDKAFMTKLANIRRIAAIL